MIEANRYSDETIHVANWLLLSGEADLDKVYADARGETLRVTRDWSDEEREDAMECVFAEQLSERLRDEVDVVLTNVVGYYGDGQLSYGFGYCGDDDYRDADIDLLIAPMIAPALQRVYWGDVATLVIEHYAEVAAAA